MRIQRMYLNVCISTYVFIYYSVILYVVHATSAFNTHETCHLMHKRISLRTNSSDEAMKRFVRVDAIPLTFMRANICADVIIIVTIN